jgi:hypothetical protein
MADILQFDPVKADLQATSRDFVQNPSEVPASTTDRVIEAQNRPGALDTAISLWRRETVLGAALERIGVNTGGDATESGFNPYRYFAEKEKEYQDLAPYVNKGLLDNVRSEAEFLAKATQLRQERFNIQTAEAGTGLGVALGMGLSLLDVTTLIPFAGPADKARRGFNVGRMAAGGATFMGGQELALQQLQELRTKEESFLNIGIGAALGGGIGLFAPVTHPALKSRIAAAVDATLEHPPAVLRPGDPASSAETVGGSAGAAARGAIIAEDSKLAGGESLLARMTRPIRGATPIQRSFEWTSNTARDVFHGMVDLGGTFTKGAQEGKAVAASVEDLVRDNMIPFESSVQYTHDALVELNKELGKQSSSLAQSVKSDVSLLTGGRMQLNPMEAHQFNQIVRRMLTNDLWQAGGSLSDVDLVAVRKLMEERGITEPAAQETVLKWADKAAKKWLKTSLDMEERMVKFGLITEDQKLGAQYGHAQLWHRENILMNRADTENFFLEVFSKRPDVSWLMDNHGLTLNDFEKLPVGDTRRLQILQEWSGDLADITKRQAAVRFEAAQAQYDNALNELDIIERGMTAVRGEIKAASFAEIRAKARNSEIALFAKKLGRIDAKLTKAESTIAAIKRDYPDLLDFADDIETTRQGAGTALDQVGAALGVRNADVTSAKEGVLSARTLRNNANPEALATARKAYQDAVAARKEAIAARNEARAAFSEAAKTYRVSQRWIDAAARKADDLARAERNALDAPGIDTAITELEAVAVKRRAKFEKAQAAREALQQERVEIQAGLRLSKEDFKAARKELSAARRGAKKADKIVPMLDVIDDIINGITDAGRAPMGILQNTVGESGRVKDRRIILTTAERRQAEEMGMLHTDLLHVMGRQWDDLAPKLAFMERFGEYDLKVHVQEIEKEYAKLIQMAPNAKVKEKLQAELVNVLEDVVVARDRLLNRSRIPDDPESWVTWGLGKLRQLNYLRFAAGFPISSFTDLAAHHLHVGFGAESHKFAMKAFDVLRESAINPKSPELLTLARAAEMVMSHSTTARLHVLDDLQHVGGVGPRGSLKQRVTSAVDRVTNTLTQRMNVYSGMYAWNTMGKTTAAIAAMSKLRDMLPNYAGLKAGQKAELAVLGIGETEAKTLAKFFGKHGKDVDGVFDPNAHLWHQEAGGADAHKQLRIAVRRIMDRAQMSPGVGDLPNLMGTTLGKLMLQFGSFGFASINRFLVPATQRLMLNGDAQAAQSFAILFGMASFVSTIRAYMNGKDPAKYSAEQWTKEVLDRSGVFAYLSPYIDAGMKLSGYSPDGVSSRYRNNAWWESLMGPWAGTLATIGQSANAVAEGDIEKFKKKAFLLAPFNQWFRIAKAFVEPPQ